MYHQHYLPRASEIHEARFQKFLREFASYETEQLLRAAQDRFLDAYSLWLRHQSPVTYEQLDTAVMILRRLDSTFRFLLPSAQGCAHA